LYRPDIDGLRAISVTLVVLYHAFPSTFSGGFIGVDVFFVISGYLITSIIHKQLNSNTFSVIQFYQRRVLRILPALLIVISSVAFVGWILVKDYEFTTFGKHIFSSAFFFVNFVYIEESGYFDLDSIKKPLLHLWSLAIEEQFYIFWPLCLIALYKFKQYLKVVLLIIIGCSLIYCYLLSLVDNNYAFFHPLSRFWELAIGGYIAYLPIYGRRFSGFISNIALVIAIALLIFATYYYNDQMLYPGIYALIPVVSAVLIITFGESSSVAKSILSNSLSVYVGKISYPLYLWHWPILSITSLMYLDTLTSIHLIALVLASVFLSITTFHLVERRINNNFYEQTKAIILLLILILLGIFGSAINTNLGYPSRSINHRPFTLDKSINSYFDIYENNNSIQAIWEEERQSAIRSKICHLKTKEQSFVSFSQNLETCLLLNETKTNILVLGDSIAADFYVSLTYALGKEHNILQLTGAGCSVGKENLSDGCRSLLNYAKEFIKTNDLLKYIVIGGSWSNPRPDYNININSVFDYIELIGNKKTYLVGPPVTFKPNVKDIIHKSIFITNQASISQKYLDKSALSLNNEMSSMSSKKGITYIDRINLYCTDKYECPIISEDGKLLIPDYGHLYVEGAKYLGNIIKKSTVIN